MLHGLEVCLRYEYEILSLVSVVNRLQLFIRNRTSLSQKLVTSANLADVNNLRYRAERNTNNSSSISDT